LGSALPLRLGQMGIPYAPDDAAARTTTTIDTLHTLWRGERMPPGKPGLPPLQPMFAPVHRVPSYVAGYRAPMMVVAGRKGDGYLARPAESIGGLRKLLRVMERSAVEAGRDPKTIDVGGYLLTFIDETRRDALNRAKRDPFVIYMMSILSDVTLRRAGLETAALYGAAEVGSAPREALAAQRKASSAELADRVGALWEIARPFSFTASTVPVAAGGALAALAGAFNPLLFLASLIGAVALHVGTNVTNEIYDVRKGVDTIVSPRASHAIVKGRISDSD